MTRSVSERMLVICFFFLSFLFVCFVLSLSPLIASPLLNFAIRKESFNIIQSFDS